MYKKILLNILILTYVISSIQIVKAESVNMNNSYGDNVKILKALSIANSEYFAVNFAETLVTRAEAVDLVVKLMAINSNNHNFEKIYSEVNETDIYSKSINVAADMGIISTENEFFRPNDPIKTSEFVKVLISALGYDYLASQSGGYPTGYYVIASKNKIIDKSELPLNVNRELLAKMLVNSLEVDLPQISSIGTYVNYQIIKGENLLKLKYNSTYHEGIVDAVYKSSLLGDTGTKLGYVKINGLEYNAGTTDINNYLGYKVKFIAREEDDKQIIISYKRDRESELEISGKDISSDTTLFKVVYKNEKGGTDEAILSNSAKILYNGLLVGSNVTSGDIKNSNKITLIDKDDDMIYDVVIIESIEVMVVSAINVKDKTVTDKLTNQTVLLDEEESSINVTVNYFLDGKIDNLKIGDVLSVARSSPQFISRSGKNVYYSSIIDIYVVPKGNIVGEVTEVSDEGLTIEGKQYEFDNTFSKEEKNIKLGLKYRFYLNKLGEIANVDSNLEETGKYGYLIDAYAEKLRDVGQFKIYTEDGNFVIYNAVKKIRSNGNDSILIKDFVENLKNSSGKVVSQFIRYSIDTKGNIKEVFLIGMVDSAVKVGFQKNTIRFFKISNTNNRFGTQFAMDTNTKVFVIPADTSREDKFDVRNLSYFVNDSDYYVESYDENSIRVAKALVVYEPESGGILEPINGDKEYGVFEKYSIKLNNENEKVYVAQVYYEGMYKEYEVIDNDSLITKINELKFGDVVAINVNSRNQLNNIVKILRYDANESAKGHNIPPNSESGRGQGLYDGYIGEIDFDSGYMTAYYYVEGEKTYRNYTITGNIYLVDSERKRISVGTNDDLYSNARVFIRSFYSKIQNIVIFK